MSQPWTLIEQKCVHRVLLEMDSLQDVTPIVAALNETSRVSGRGKVRRTADAVCAYFDTHLLPQHLGAGHQIVDRRNHPFEKAGVAVGVGGDDV